MSFIAQTRVGPATRLANPRSGKQMVDLEKGDWRSIAEQASAEENPAKMALLVEQLCRELDREANLSPLKYREPMS
jgi:hypothetical protein